ncbi:MAG: PH domain-containing protein [Lutispora sp.]|nr:PH domain-containing protein [Lutispora sp.]
MGFFDLKAICGVCDRETGLNRFKVKKPNAWICPECLKKAGGITSVDFSKVTIEDIKQMIEEKEWKQEKRSNAFINEPLSTAEGMYRYCIENNLGSGWNEKWGGKHFKIIENNLLDGEKVHLTFIGLHNYISATKHGNNFAYAITNKRIMMAQKNTIAGEKFQSVSLDNINDITFKSGVALGTVTVDTIKETFNIGLSKVSAKLINSKIHEVINDIKNNKGNGKLESNDAASTADELKKFKELLDMGALTQEEFDIKKKQLLNL